MRFVVFSRPLLLAVVILISSCNDKILKVAGGAPSETSLGDLAPEGQIGWNLIQSKVLVTCFQCHGTSQAPVFQDPASVLANAGKILEKVETNIMPPASKGYLPLSECQKGILSLWLSEGGPLEGSKSVSNVAACKTPIGSGDLPIEKMPITYGTLLSKILQPHCLKCHTSENSQEIDASGILFYPLNVLNSPGQVERWLAPAKQSKVIEMLTKTDDARMPPPEEEASLSPAEIEFVRKWIDSGRPE